MSLRELNKKKQQRRALQYKKVEGICTYVLFKSPNQQAKDRYPFHMDDSTFRINLRYIK